jgi:general secretion pathway protein I
MNNSDCGFRNAEWKQRAEQETRNGSSIRACLIPKSAFRIPNSKGFTLLEVMVAVSIMATVLVSLLGLKNRSMQDVALEEHITKATVLAKRTMVDVLFSKPSQPVEDEGAFPEEEYKDYTWKKTISPTPFAEIMEVRVAVLWKEGERPEMVELVSYE